MEPVIRARKVRIPALSQSQETFVGAAGLTLNAALPDRVGSWCVSAMLALRLLSAPASGASCKPLVGVRIRHLPDINRREPPIRWRRGRYLSTICTLRSKNNTRTQR